VQANMGTARMENMDSGFLMVVPKESEWNIRSNEDLNFQNCIFDIPLIGHSLGSSLGSWVDQLGSMCDFEIIRQWITRCRTYHGPSCNLRKSANDTFQAGFKLIDCISGKVASASPAYHYVALSYVWGNREKSSTEKDDEDDRNNWPRTVRDAILITRELGYQYLWVDRYCIDQLNENEKHSQISNMDSIYNLAQITIISAAGKDAGRGLPGVGTNKRRVLDHVRIGDHGSTLLFTASADADEELLQSTWSTRGWTYQEGVLSRRRLIFTESQVIFECSSIRLYENIPLDLERFESDGFVQNVVPSQPLLGLRQNWDIGAKADVAIQVDETKWRARSRAISKQKRVEREERQQAREAKLVNLDGHIHRYCDRTLSFPEDSLNAFLGILRFSGRSSYYGLELAWRYNKAIFVVSLLRWQRFMLRNDLPGVPAVAADGKITTSANDATGVRISELPSWSWVGWNGKLCLVGQQEFINLRRTAPIIFSTLDGKPLVPQDIDSSGISTYDDWSAHLSKRIWVQTPDVWSNVRYTAASFHVRNIELDRNKVDFEFQFESHSFSLEMRLCGQQVDSYSPELITQDLRSGRVEAIRLLDNWLLLVRSCEEEREERGSIEVLFERVGTICCDFRKFRGREVPLGILHKSQKTFCIV
jgi:hypothetical protein